MKHYRFTLSISAQEYLHYYRGSANQVIAKEESGLIVKFPARLLQEMVTRNGIHGRFLLSCDNDFSNARLQRLGDLPLP